jgi:hypothetical protein
MRAAIAGRVRILVALLLLAHGVAHGVGFAGAWRLSPQIPYKTTLLAGRLDAGPTGIRVVGVIWLVLAAAFALTAAGAFARAGWWHPLALGIAAASLVLCVLAVPDAKIGVAVNVVLLVGLAVARGRVTR